MQAHPEEVCAGGEQVAPRLPIAQQRADHPVVALAHRAPEGAVQPRLHAVTQPDGLRSVGARRGRDGGRRAGLAGQQERQQAHWLQHTSTLPCTFCPPTLLACRSRRCVLYSRATPSAVAGAPGRPDGLRMGGEVRSHGVRWAAQCLNGHKVWQPAALLLAGSGCACMSGLAPAGLVQRFVAALRHQPLQLPLEKRLLHLHFHRRGGRSSRAVCDIAGSRGNAAGTRQRRCQRRPPDLLQAEDVGAKARQLLQQQPLAVAPLQELGRAVVVHAAIGVLVREGVTAGRAGEARGVVGGPAPRRQAASGSPAGRGGSLPCCSGHASRCSMHPPGPALTR